MEELVGKVSEIKETLNYEIKANLDDNNVESAKQLVEFLEEISELDDNATIKITESLMGDYCWEEVKTLTDIIDDTKTEFMCGLNGVVYYGSDTQEVGMLNDREKEILLNYMSVFNDRLKQNIKAFENKEEE